MCQRFDTCRNSAARSIRTERDDVSSGGGGGGGAEDNFGKQVEFFLRARVKVMISANFSGPTREKNRNLIKKMR